MSIVHWVAALDRPFGALLALPFLVGLAGLVAEYLGQHRKRSALSLTGSGQPGLAPSGVRPLMALRRAPLRLRMPPLNSERAKSRRTLINDAKPGIVHRKPVSRGE